MQAMHVTLATRPAAAFSGRAARLQPACARPRPRLHAVPTQAFGGGYKKWKGQWDGSKLDPKLQTRLLTYGELAQSTYDNLNMNICDPVHVGDSQLPPDSFLAAYDYDYSLVPKRYLKQGDPGPKSGGQGTKDKFGILLNGPPGLSPFIRALPGQGRAPIRLSPKDLDLWKRLLAWVSNKVDLLWFETASAAVERLAQFNARPLFRKKETTGGRGVQPVSAFIGFVATSPPNPKLGDEVEAAFVWRGTIFKEEWANNFSQDRLVKWDTESKYWDSEEPRPAPVGFEVGVHDGFSDLYLRPCSQKAGKLKEDILPESEKDSPRTVVHAWLAYLFEHYKVTAISTTGHSLGAGLCTVSAFDIGEQVEDIFSKPVPDTWRTLAAPRITTYSFAAPRVGNYAFLKRFSDDLLIRHLRVSNKPDVVPKVPGGLVQFLTTVDARFGLNLYSDMDAWGVRAFAWWYAKYCSFWAAAGYPSKWGYFHTGQILEVDSSQDLGKEALDGSPLHADDQGKAHNLELYLHLLSKFKASSTYRNFFLLNKSDDIVGTDATRPTCWWADPAHWGMGLGPDGRWDYLGTGTAGGAPSPAPAKAPTNTKP